MRKIFIVLFTFLYTISYAQKRTDANIVGHVTSNKEHVPFVQIFIKGTTIGTSTDETGHFQLINLPVGRHVIVAQSMGYTTSEREVFLVEGETREIKFNLKEDVLGLN